MPSFVPAVIQWFDDHARDLPWRDPDAGPWAVMVSEFMLQQTPVNRVLGPWHEWVTRWPTPAALADVPPGEAIRAWGRLGYPRRALRLHAAATTIRDAFDGVVPADEETLRSLPGVGEYTAAAIASFAHGRRAVVVDVNIRRVLARAVCGKELSTSPATDRTVAAEILPDDAPTAVRWSAAVMELGALVCTAANPACDRCPIADRCAWRAAGRPVDTTTPRRRQAWAGTDRQCRGRLMAVLRSADAWVEKPELDLVWNDVDQRERCLLTLVDDGLVVVQGERYALPH